MALINRYSGSERGTIVITGNTLGLSRQRFTQNPGTDNAINQFITTNVLLPTPASWSAIANLANNENITFDWTQNSSSAFLNMLSGYTVLYAELIWGGMSISNSTSGPPVNVSSSINNPITLTTPLGNTISINPDPATARTQVLAGSGTFYARTQNITNIVATYGVGKYTVGGVPSAININEVNTLNNAGWTMIVAYKNLSLTPKNMNIYVGEELIGGGNFVDIAVNGFLTPPLGPLSGRLSVSAQEGDASITGDQMLFGPNINSLTALSGPNNPVNNFFASQINIGDPNNPNVGKIDTTGTFGNRNANASAGTDIVAGRQGWDITNVDCSSELTNSQSSSVVRITSSGDVYLVNSLGIAIETILISSNKTADVQNVNIGGIINYTVTLTNEGALDQSNIGFVDTAPPGTTYLPSSLNVSTSYSGTDLPTGITINTIPAGKTVLITWQVQVGNSIPNPNPIQNTGQVLVPGLPPQNTNIAITHVNNTDISIVKTATPNPAIPGQQLVFTIVVSNAGPDTAENVNISDYIPLSLSGVQFSTDGGTTWNTWSGIYTVGPLTSGASQTILIRGTVRAFVTNDIINTATVSSTTPDPNTINNSYTIDVEVNPTADISVIKKGLPNPIISGKQITYTIEVANLGPSFSSNVTLSDIVPNNISGAEFSTDGGVTFTPWTGSYNLGTISNTFVQDFILKGNLNSSALGTLVNIASVTSSTFDPNINNNISTSTIPIIESADISVIKTVFPNTIIAGGVVRFTMLISNAGPSDSQNVILTDTIVSNINSPAFSTDGGVTFNPWPGSYNLGILASGFSQSILIRGLVDSSSSTTISNTAVVSSSTPDPNPDNNTSTINAPLSQVADISVVKTQNPSPPIAGELLTYTIVVSNAGPSDSQGVILTDDVSNELLNQEFSTDGGLSWNLWTGSYKVGTLIKGVSKTILIRGTVEPDSIGNLGNTAVVSSITPDPNPNNNSSTVVTPINDKADIGIQKIGSPNPVVAGEMINYSLIVSNLGPSVAVDITVTDVVPTNIKNVEFSIDEGKTWQSWENSYVISSLGVGKNITILIRGLVGPQITQSISNTASVSSPIPDPNPNNNISTSTISVNDLADISVVKTASPNPVNAGENITYSMVILNEGPSYAQNVILTDTISSNIINPEFSGDGGVTWNPWLGSYNLGLLVTNMPETILIRGKVISSNNGILTNTAVVGSNTPDPNPDNNISTVNTNVNNSADISVVKIASKKFARFGECISYMIVVGNAGPSNAENVLLKEIFPPELANIEISINGGITWNSINGIYRLGTIENGKALTILVRGVVNSKCAKTIINTVAVESTTQDLNLLNNVSTAEVVINTPSC